MSGNVEAPPGLGGTGARAQLNREVVVMACLDFVDAYGPAHLTIRRLASHLGVQAMSVYRYTSGRESLLRAAVSHVLGDVYHEMTRRRWPSWAAYARHLAYTVRREAIHHPRLFPVMARQPVQAAFLYPPLCHVPLVEDLLWTLRDHGLSDRDAATVYRALSRFLLGSLLLETAPRSMPQMSGSPGIGVSVGDLSPALMRLRHGLGTTDEQIQFEQELEAVLGRLSASMEGSGERGPGEAHLAPDQL
ncbi:MAG: TetR/AcrR family transcriptional regulator C-terminal domain-containing protein [Ornithinimicrobium sp.]